MGKYKHPSCSDWNPPDLHKLKTCELKPAPLTIEEIKYYQTESDLIQGLIERDISEQCQRIKDKISHHKLPSLCHVNTKKGEERKR